MDPKPDENMTRPTKKSKEFSPDKDWFSHNIPIWEKELGRLKGKPIKALHIGVFEGRAVCWTMDHILCDPGSTIDCVDPFMISDDQATIGGNRVRDRFIKNTVEYINRVGVFQQTSNDFFQCEETQGKIYDLIYIDGSHITEDVRKDITNSWQHLSPGGIMIFDDYEWKNDFPNQKPAIAIDEFLSAKEGEYDILHKGYQVIIQRKAE